MTQESLKDESSSERTHHGVDHSGDSRKAISSREHRAEQARAWQRMQYMESPLDDTAHDEARDGEK